MYNSQRMQLLKCFSSQVFSQPHPILDLISEGKEASVLMLVSQEHPILMKIYDCMN